MKKQTVVMISVIALLLLVIVSFGIYGYMNYQNSKKPQNIEVFSCLPSEIVKYSVTNGSEKYTLVKDEEEWKVEDNDVAVLDQKVVQDVINGASRITSQGILKKKALKEFEVIEVQSLELTLSDGTVVSLKFVGIKGETCALRVGDDNDIYSVRKSTRDILIASLDKLRVSLVFEELMKIDEILTYYSFTDYDKTKTVVRTKNAAEISNTKANRYVMEEPYRKDVDDEKFEQQILVRIPSIAAASYVDDFPENLEDYGLDEESCAVLSFKWGNLDETLYLGTSEGGKIHAVKKGKDGVFVINSSQLEFLHTEPFYILESGILKSDVENIYRITVRRADESFDITASGRNSTNGRFYVNGNAASQAAFNSAVQALGSLEILSEITKAPENTNDISVTVYYDNGTPAQSISLVPSGSKEYAAFINGKAEFAVNRDTVDSLMSIIKDISNNPMKTEEKG